jgi:ubiquinone biosynthesis protein
MTMLPVTAVVSTTVTILVAPFFIAVAALLYAFAVRRLLGLRLGGLRTLIAGVLAILVASLIITALFGNNSTKNSGILPARGSSYSARRSPSSPA